jgi:hypothetical protein
MAEPMPPKHRVSLTEILTIDDLINLVSSKAHTRGGRIVTGASALVLLGAIIVAPIVIRSNQSGAGPSSTPTIPVVTVPPNTNRTAFVVPPVDTKVNGSSYRIGPNPNASPTTAAAPKVTAPPATTAPVTLPPVTAPAQTYSPPPTFPPPTFAPPPTAPPVTAPPATTPLTVLDQPINTPGH